MNTNMKSIKIFENINYAGTGNPCQTLHLIMPEHSAKPVPLIVLIHGGGWHAGSKDTYVEVGRDIAARGFAAATLDYRLSGEVPFPGAVEDVRLALRFLRTQADSYGYDPDRTALFGNSAGAHLASMAALVTEKDGFDNGNLPGPPCSILAVVNSCGPVNFSTIIDQMTPEARDEYSGLFFTFLGGKERPDLERVVQKASPVSYVREALPSFFILHGALDDCVPVQQADEFTTLLKARGNSVVYKCCEKAGHNVFRENYEENLREIVDFFQVHLH